MTAPSILLPSLIVLDVFQLAMSSIRLKTIWDFYSHGIMVQVFCRQCGHKAEKRPIDLRQWCLETGCSLRIREVERRLRCKVCKAKAANIYPGGMVKE